MCPASSNNLVVRPLIPLSCSTATPFLRKACAAAVTSLHSLAARTPSGAGCPLYSSYRDTSSRPEPLSPPNVINLLALNASTVFIASSRCCRRRRCLRTPPVPFTYCSYFCACATRQESSEFIYRSFFILHVAEISALKYFIFISSVIYLINRLLVGV